jgi:hypothetical protein
MSDTAKIIMAVLGVFAAGFYIVGTSESTDAEKKSEAFVTGYGSMSKMASSKCPKAVKEHTGTSVYFPSNVESDKQSYITMTWEGDSKANFKTAVCKFVRARGGIETLTIDGKDVISK